MSESRSPQAGFAVVVIAAAAVVASAVGLNSAPTSVRPAVEDVGKASVPIPPTYAEDSGKPSDPKESTPATEPPKTAAKDGEWILLFDGKTLEGCTPTRFGGEGDVMVEEGRIVMTQGNDMTGVTSTRKDLPTSNYEIEWEGQRVDGNDFFCGLTFPVKMNPCSLILGGWGGSTCGLSSIDGFDASENSTSTFETFDKGKWYQFKLRVTDPMIVAWLDGKELLTQELEGRRISIRSEVELSRPLGFSTWRTTGAVRNVRLRKIDPKAEAKSESKAAAK